jgi:ATP-binding cassette, subfamily B, bacterial
MATTPRAPRRTRDVDAALLSRPHRATLGLAASLILAEAVLELARPWPLKFVVDQGLGHQPYPHWAGSLAGVGVAGLALLAGAAVVVLSLAGGLASAGSALLVGRVAERIGTTLRGRLVARMLDQPPSFFRRHRSAELVNRLTSDVRRVEDAVVAWWEIAVPEAVVLVGTLVMLAVIDPVLALTALAVCPALAIVIVVRRRLVRRAQGHAREQEGRLSEQAQDLIRNVRVVQAFGRQPEMNLAFDRLSQRTRQANVAALQVEARLAPLADLILAIGSAGVLVLGAVRVQQGSMSTGTLLVGLTYVAGLYVPLRSLTSLAATLARAEASRDRLREVFAARVAGPAEGLPVRDLRGNVVLESVRFGYDARPVLDGVDLAFEAGRVTALTGPTGVGKSTVLNLLLRFEDPQSGLVTVGGRDLRMLAVEGVRRHIAYVPQESWFLDDTIRHNIALGHPGASEEEIRSAADNALVSVFARRLPDGLDTVVGESGLMLSGGERKRLAIARAVVRRADLFLLDEPTAGLDDQAAQTVLAAISASTCGHTVVVVTHDPRVVRWADDVVHLAAAPDPDHDPADLAGAVPTSAGRR